MSLPHQWLTRFRDSLNLKLLLPLLLVGLGAAAGGGWAIYATLHHHTHTEMVRWGATLADAVNYAAEASQTEAELERFVTALGGEPEVGTIAVVAGEPPRVLAATRMAWWQEPMTEVEAPHVRRHLRTAMDGEPVSHWGSETVTVHTALPLKVHRPAMDPSRLASGAIYLGLTPSGELADFRQHAATAATIFVGIALLLTALGYAAIHFQVLRPLTALQAAVERRHRGDTTAYAPADATDEIGDLSREVNHLLDVQEERTTMYRQMFTEHPAVQILVDPDGPTIEDINPAAAAFYGYTPDQLRGAPLARIHASASEDLTHLTQLARTEGFEGPLQQQLADGQLREVHVSSAPIRVGDRTLLYAIVHDVTAEKRYRRKLETYQEVFHSLPVGIYRTTTEPPGRFLEVNPAMAEIFEAESMDQLLAHPVAELYEDPEERRAFTREIYEEGVVERREVRLRTLKGNRIWGALTAHRSTDAQGRTIFDGVVVDISERKRLEAELKYQANHDALTGTYNRLKFNELLDHEIGRARRYGSALALIMLDLDHFKAINDTYGHTVGDEILKQLVAITSERLRETDVLTRWGGEEFMILCPETDRAGALSLAEELRTVIAAAAFPVPDTVTASFGVAQYAPEEERESLITRVDDALYRAKGEGRNRITTAQEPPDG